MDGRLATPDGPPSSAQSPSSAAATRTAKRVKMEHSSNVIDSHEQYQPNEHFGVRDEQDAVEGVGGVEMQNSQGDRNVISSVVATGASGSSSAPHAQPAIGHQMMSNGLHEADGARKDERASEVDQLQDLLGMSGVDLRAEEEAIHGQTGFVSSFNGSMGAENLDAALPTNEQRQVSFYLDVVPLSHRIHKIASKHGLEVDPSVLMLISRATRMRCHNLLASMVQASRHRQWSSHLRPPPSFRSNGKPMFHESISDDPLKMINALVRAEKAEEQAARQLRLEREETEARLVAGQESEEGGLTSSGQRVDGAAQDASEGAQIEGSSAGGDEGKRKGKKQGASAAARNMTEDKRLKLANKTAARALGISSGSTKAWMFGGGNVSGDASLSKLGKGGGASRLPKPRFGQSNADGFGHDRGKEGGGADFQRAGDNGHASAANPGGWGDLAARQRRKEEEERERRRRVNLDDALHALEMERKGGAGRGSGERSLFVIRSLGRPTIPISSQQAQ